MRRNPGWSRDELILALDLYFHVNPAHINKNHPKIITLSNILNELPIHRTAFQNNKFRNPNGVYMKLCNFLRFDPHYHGKGLRRGAKLEKIIWAEFADNKEILMKTANAIRNNYKQLQSLNKEDSNEIEEAREGKILTQLHIVLERRKSLVERKILQSIRQKNKLECEACGLDFIECYGEAGKKAAECHNNNSLFKLNAKEKTNINNYSLVCANCHRIIHKSKPWLSIEYLKSVRRSNYNE